MTWNPAQSSDGAESSASLVRDWAAALQRGELSLDEFLQRMAERSVAITDDAQVDLDRQRRCGFPEVVYSPGKSAEAMQAIFERLLAAGQNVLATRVDPQQADYLLARFPHARHNAVARTLRIVAAEVAGDGNLQQPPAVGRVVVVTAGSSDRPVAEEALETVLWMGSAASLILDVGVAGPQRLLRVLPQLAGVDAIVVTAGMEGALPSVVGGHVPCPVIAVPTSVGYGANLAGVSALLSMLNSCAANVTVVNIDAGFKGGYVAGLIARQSAAARSATSYEG